MYLLLVDGACLWCMSSENFGPESDSRICAKLLGRDFLVNPSWNWLGFRLEIVLIEIKTDFDDLGWTWFRLRSEMHGSDLRLDLVMIKFDLVPI
jgi:hypothetical protein